MLYAEFVKERVVKVRIETEKIFVSTIGYTLCHKKNLRSRRRVREVIKLKIPKI